KTVAISGHLTLLRWPHHHALWRSNRPVPLASQDVSLVLHPGWSLGLVGRNDVLIVRESCQPALGHLDDEARGVIWLVSPPVIARLLGDFCCPFHQGTFLLLRVMSGSR